MTYPDPTRIVATISSDLATMKLYKPPLIMGISSALVPVSNMLPHELQDHFFKKSEGSNLSVNEAVDLLDVSARKIIAMDWPTEKPNYDQQSVREVLKAADIVSSGMTHAAALLKEVFLRRKAQLSTINGGIVGAIILCLIIIYFRIFRRLVRMLEHDKESTLRLLLLIPPETAKELNLIESLQKSAESESFLSTWGVRFVRRMFQRRRSQDRSSDHTGKLAETDFPLKIAGDEKPKDWNAGKGLSRDSNQPIIRTAMLCEDPEDTMDLESGNRSEKPGSSVGSLNTVTNSNRRLAPKSPSGEPIDQRLPLAMPALMEGGNSGTFDRRASDSRRPRSYTRRPSRSDAGDLLPRSESASSVTLDQPPPGRRRRGSVDGPSPRSPAEFSYGLPESGVRFLDQ
ncbi:hypothetical protein BC832DRAFT_436976 [Gaertneriomyces semiglobifer]|nr:hypothetical protein BC832DRAFT_436976 [Gaertneriomyces semiglobifer]